MKGRTWLLSGFGAAAPEFCAQVTQGVCERLVEAELESHEEEEGGAETNESRLYNCVSCD